MQGVTHIEQDRGGPGAVQGGGQFVADAAALAHSADDDFAFLADSGQHQLDGPGEGFINSCMQPLQLFNFQLDDAAGFFGVIHGHETLDRESVAATKCLSVERFPAMM